MQHDGCPMKRADVEMGWGWVEPGGDGCGSASDANQQVAFRLCEALFGKWPGGEGGMSSAGQCSAVSAVRPVMCCAASAVLPVLSSPLPPPTTSLAQHLGKGSSTFNRLASWLATVSVLRPCSNRPAQQIFPVISRPRPPSLSLPLPSRLSSSTSTSTFT